MNNVLVVDDDNEFRETLIKALKQFGYRAMGINNPDALASTIVVQRPDVILLDMMFDADMAGLRVCEQLRAWSAIPVLILSVINDDKIKVKVLDAGADDFLVKPFSVSELTARIRAIERRLTNTPRTANAHIVCTGKLLIDFDMRIVKLDDQPLHLTRKEYALLKALAEAQGRLVTYERLLATIWTDENATEQRKVRALVMQLRNKLNEDLSNPTYILTEAGVGYRLNMEPDGFSTA
ncbi:MAG: response regulator transcription factor [Anaerolineae bacterium]|nr:response regulator transcription factor [Anaerolineae bacterium]